MNTKMRKVWEEIISSHFAVYFPSNVSFSKKVKQEIRNKHNFIVCLQILKK